MINNLESITEKTAQDESLASVTIEKNNVLTGSTTPATDEIWSISIDTDEIEEFELLALLEGLTLEAYKNNVDFFNDTAKIYGLPDEVECDEIDKTDENKNAAYERANEWAREAFQIDKTPSKIINHKGYNSNELENTETLKQATKDINEETASLSSHLGVQKFIKKFSTQNAIIFKGFNTLSVLLSKSYEYYLNKNQEFIYAPDKANSAKFTSIFSFPNLRSKVGSYFQKNIKKGSEPSKIQEHFESVNLQDNNNNDQVWLKYESRIKPHGQNDARLNHSKFVFFGINDEKILELFKKLDKPIINSIKILEMLRNLDVSDAKAVSEFLKTFNKFFKYNLHEMIARKHKGEVTINFPLALSELTALFKDRLSNEDSKKINTIGEFYSIHGEILYSFNILNSLSILLNPNNNPSNEKFIIPEDLKNRKELANKFTPTFDAIANASKTGNVKNLINTLRTLIYNTHIVFPEAKPNELIKIFAEQLKPFFIGLEFESDTLKAIEEIVNNRSAVKYDTADKAVLNETKLAIEIVKKTLTASNNEVIDYTNVQKDFNEYLEKNAEIYLDNIFKFYLSNDVNNVINNLKMFGKSIQKIEPQILNNMLERFFSRNIHNISYINFIIDMINFISIAPPDNQIKLLNNNENYKKVFDYTQAAAQKLKPYTSDKEDTNLDKTKTDQISREITDYFYNELLNSKAQEKVKPLTEAINKLPANMPKLKEKLQNLEEVLYQEYKSDLDKVKLKDIIAGTLNDKQNDVVQVIDKAAHFVNNLNQKQGSEGKLVNAAQEFKNTTLQLTTRQKIIVAVSGVAGAIIGCVAGVANFFTAKKTDNVVRSPIKGAAVAKEAFEAAAAPGGKGFKAALSQLNSCGFFVEKINPRQDAVGQVVKTAQESTNDQSFPAALNQSSTH